MLVNPLLHFLTHPEAVQGEGADIGDFVAGHKAAHHLAQVRGRFAQGNVLVVNMAVEPGHQAL